MYHTLVAKASGELCLKHIFSFGAFARSPLLQRCEPFFYCELRLLVQIVTFGLWIIDACHLLYHQNWRFLHLMTKHHFWVQIFWLESANNFYIWYPGLDGLLTSWWGTQKYVCSVWNHTGSTGTNTDFWFWCVWGEVVFRTINIAKIYEINMLHEVVMQPLFT